MIRHAYASSKMLFQLFQAIALQELKMIVKNKKTYTLVKLNMQKK